MSRLGLSPGVSFWKRPNSIGFDVDDIGGVRSLRMDNFVDFLLNDVRVAPQDVEKLQIHPIAPYCFVGLPTEEKMKEVWDRIKDGVRWTGKGFVLPFLCGDTYTEVKVKGCCYGLSEQDLVSIMDYYGEVISCKEFRTRTKGVGGQEGGRTGDFLLKMKLRLSIPRLLPTAKDGELWAAYYEGQEDVCWKCFESGHQSRACPNPNQGPRAFARDQKEERSLQMAVVDPAADSGGDMEDEQAEEGTAGLPDQDADELDGDEGGDDEDGAEGAQGQPQGDAREESLNLHFTSTPAGVVPDIHIQESTPISFNELALRQHAEDLSAMEKFDSQDMFSGMEESLQDKDTATTDKRDRTASDSDMSNKAKEPRLLQSAPIGERRDSQRGSSGNLNVVSRGQSPIASRATGSKPNLVARTSVDERRRNIESLTAIERRQQVKQKKVKGGK